MNKLQKTLGIGALLVLAASSCTSPPVSQTTPESSSANQKLESRVDEYGDNYGSYRNVARYHVTDAAKYLSLNGNQLLYWNSAASQTLDKPQQKKVLDALLERAEELVVWVYPAEVVDDYFNLARELGQKNGFILPEQRATDLLNISVQGQISYELRIAKSRIVDNDFLNSAQIHLNNAMHVARKFGVDIPSSQHKILYNEVKDLLKSRYGINVPDNKK